jgi:hypothetical protein
LSATVITEESAILELEKCKGRFVTICNLETGGTFSGEAVMVRRYNGTVEMCLAPIPFNKWSRPRPAEIPVGNGSIRAAYSEKLSDTTNLTTVHTWSMTIHLKEMCPDCAGNSS